MSGPNAARTLPPGDRDERPSQAAEPPVAGREVGGGNTELLPGIMLDIAAIGTLLDEEQMALGDLKLARAQGDWALLESSARRVARLAAHTERTITQCRVRIASHVPAKTEPVTSGV